MKEVKNKSSEFHSLTPSKKQRLLFIYEWLSLANTILFTCKYSVFFFFTHRGEWKQKKRKTRAALRAYVAAVAVGYFFKLSSFIIIIRLVTGIRVFFFKQLRHRKKNIKQEMNIVINRYNYCFVYSFKLNRYLMIADFMHGNDSLRLFSRLLKICDLLFPFNKMVQRF